jgi:hypothetical protein
VKFRVFVGLPTKVSFFSIATAWDDYAFEGGGGKWALSLELITCTSFAYPMFQFWTFRGVYHIQHEVLLLLLLFFPASPINMKKLNSTK